MPNKNKSALNFDVRAARASQFAGQIIGLLQDFLPTNGKTLNYIYERLAKEAYKSNALIVNLPLEFDKLNELAAKRAMIEKMLEPIIIHGPDNLSVEIKKPADE